MATQEAINKCKEMTDELKAALKKQELANDVYVQHMTEYQRQLGLFNSSKAVYNRVCAGNCANGGVQERKCDPLCLNWLRLNPKPIEPTKPPPINTGTFICQICAQKVDIDATADDIEFAKNAIQQQQECTINLEEPKEDPINEIPISVPISEVVNEIPVETTKPAPPVPEKIEPVASGMSTSTIIIIVIFIFIVFIAALVAIYFYMREPAKSIRT